MATKFDIQVRNGAVTITVGGQSGATGAASGGDGFNSSTPSGGNGFNAGTPSGGDGFNAGTPSGGNDPDSVTRSGGENDGNCCCAPVVIGPVVISGGTMGTGTGARGGNGRDSGTFSGGNGFNAGTPSGGDGFNAGTPSGGNGHNADTSSGGNGRAPRSNGCCCAPVVIGPIVISGCCADQGSESAMVTAPKRVTVDPPAQSLLFLKSTPPSTTLPFSIQTQLESNWCWAAVAVSIYDFFAPGSGTWTQNALATTLLKQQGHKSANCEEHPSGHVCNRPEPLDAALKITGNLRDKGAHFNQYLSFECIQNWISAQLPLGARIVWRGGGAHFIAFDGYKVTTSGRKLVHVGDPASNANAGPGFHDYEHVVEDYEQVGYWNDTYLVSPNT